MTWDLTQPIILENERVRLEPLTRAHYDALLPIALNNPGLMEFSPQSIDSEENLQSYIEKALTERANGQRYPFAIFDKDISAFAGSTSYGNISQPDDRVEIGWTWIGRNHQGTGLNMSMKYLMLQHAFEVLGVKCLQLCTHHENYRSQAAIKKLGATLDGILRSNTAMRDGKRRDTMVFSILEAEWAGVRDLIFSWG